MCQCVLSRFVCVGCMHTCLSVYSVGWCVLGVCIHVISKMPVCHTCDTVCECVTCHVFLHVYYVYVYVCVSQQVTWLIIRIQPIADRVAQHLEFISKTLSTNQNSAHGIYDEYHVINAESHENPGTPGTKLKVFRNNLKTLCHPICYWLHTCVPHSKWRDSLYVYCQILQVDRENTISRLFESAGTKEGKSWVPSWYKGSS